MEASPTMANERSHVYPLSSATSPSTQLEGLGGAMPRMRLGESESRTRLTMANLELLESEITHTRGYTIPRKDCQACDVQPYSDEQIRTEIQEIYDTLVSTEKKCKEVVNKWRSGVPARQGGEQCEEMRISHQQLIQLHFDFYLACQHPRATTKIQKLPIKHFMSDRLWLYGFQSLFDLHDSILPRFRDHMLKFIYFAYSMMTLLLETVSIFEGKWIECLGDLGRYLMYIEGRVTWTETSRRWYIMSARRSPTIGRLYHHLDQGYCIAISNCIALLGYGQDTNPLTTHLKLSPLARHEQVAYPAALIFFIQTAKTHLDRLGDRNTLSFLHVTLVFLRHVASCPPAAHLLFPSFPWHRLVTTLNNISGNIAAIESPSIPGAQDTAISPLPEDWFMAGLPWADCIPDAWFEHKNIEPEDHYIETEGLIERREERILWLGVQIAREGDCAESWLRYEGKGLFSVGTSYGEAVVTMD